MFWRPITQTGCDKGVQEDLLWLQIGLGSLRLCLLGRLWIQVSVWHNDYKWYSLVVVYECRPTGLAFIPSGPAFRSPGALGVNPGPVGPEFPHGI